MNKTVAVVPERDESLVSKALQGDKSAFGLLVSRYEKRVFALVMEMVNHRQDAEDITQEVFVRVYFSLKNFRAESSFYTWLYRIAYNMTIDFKRRVARRPQDAVANSNREGEISNIEPLSNVQQPDDVIDSQERQTTIRAALSEISEEHRAVIILREVDGLSYDEISRVTGSARGTVMSRLYYARKHLQKVLRGLRSGVDSGNPEGGETEKLTQNNKEDSKTSVEHPEVLDKRWKLSGLLAKKFSQAELSAVEFNLEKKGAKI